MGLKDIFSWIVGTGVGVTAMPMLDKMVTGHAPQTATAIAYIGATFAVPSERPQQEIFFRKPAAFGALAIPGQAAGRGSFKFSLA